MTVAACSAPPLQLRARRRVPSVHIVAVPRGTVHQGRSNRAFARNGREDVEITFLRRPNAEGVQHRVGSIRVAAVGDVYAEAVLSCPAGTRDR
jgi:hypothetical protein